MRDMILALEHTTCIHARSPSYSARNLIASLGLGELDGPVSSSSWLPHCISGDAIHCCLNSGWYDSGFANFTRAKPCHGQAISPTPS